MTLEHFFLYYSKHIFLPSPRGASLHLAFQFLHIRMFACLLVSLDQILVPSNSLRDKGTKGQTDKGTKRQTDKGNLGTWELENLELGNLKTWELGNLGTWELGNLGTWKPGNLESWKVENLRT